MTLKVIGNGFGRTGTTSVKLALETLGYGPCYHMFELIANPSHVTHWQAALEGRLANWGNIFSAYQTSLDWPACAFWEEQWKAYPDAKIVLTVRDPESWHKSFMATLYPAMTEAKSEVSPLLQLAKRVVLENTFHGKADDSDYAISIFNHHIADVKNKVPAENLLIYDVNTGWDPLCAFLDCPVPDIPFPVKNTRSDYQAYRKDRDRV